MPSVDDTPPDYVINDLTRLKEELKRVPKKKDNENILIATWNIRCFGDLTEKWKTDSKDSPKRNLHALFCIAEIISRFDVVAVQEVKNNIKALRHTLKLLGPNWGFLMTDITKGDLGNDERLAFLFDRNRVKPSGLACELVVPEKVKKNPAVEANAFQRQFARTPYAVSFVSANKTFILVTLHVHFVSKSLAIKRKPELIAIAKWLASWAKTSKSFGHNFLALGDFNIDRKDDDLYDAFYSTGLFTPDDLNLAPRTIFSNPKKPTLKSFYDQIAWFTGKSKDKPPALNLKYIKGGYIDFKGKVMSSLTNTKLSWRISDHYPLWAEFEV
jgi:endonuclease/exonuclease/phosphatase family metal-dependent hydrolase